ncbi:hypothetical protein K3165_02065 [Qipengyuania sp. 1XM1-15A]|uniref:hypothetical protein n=1 Tax=Qipengyuania xiamenensis TaxID=2867237 RepID=UPI001C879717|nr:hypothetical protein [Qipengyuania xiamenensis]MBX7531705.1 hypothetical protein [Qipengyuania xiamenensis]
MSAPQDDFMELPNSFLDIDKTDLWTVDSQMRSLKPGETIWTHFPIRDGTGELWSSDGNSWASSLLFKRGGPHSRISGLPLHIKVVGYFVRALCLWQGPRFKLADWKELPAGKKMMLSPVQCEKEQELADFRVGYFRRNGTGQFQLINEEDGSLWVGRA